MGRKNGEECRGREAVLLFTGLKILPPNKKQNADKKKTRRDGRQSGSSQTIEVELEEEMVPVGNESIMIRMK